MNLYSNNLSPVLSLPVDPFPFPTLKKKKKTKTALQYFGNPGIFNFRLWSVFPVITTLPRTFTDVQFMFLLCRFSSYFEKVHRRRLGYMSLLHTDVVTEKFPTAIQSAVKVEYQAIFLKCLDL